MTRTRGQTQFCHNQALIFSKLGRVKEPLGFAYLKVFKSNGEIGITSVHAALNCFSARTGQQAVHHWHSQSLQMVSPDRWVVDHLYLKV